MAPKTSKGAPRKPRTTVRPRPRCCRRPPRVWAGRRRDSGPPPPRGAVATQPWRPEGTTDGGRLTPALVHHSQATDAAVGSGDTHVSLEDVRPYWCARVARQGAPCAPHSALLPLQTLSRPFGRQGVAVAGAAGGAAPRLGAGAAALGRLRGRRARAAACCAGGGGTHSPAPGGRPGRRPVPEAGVRSAQLAGVGVLGPRGGAPCRVRSTLKP